MDDFLVKPLRAADLRATMERLAPAADGAELPRPADATSADRVFDPQKLIAACGQDGATLTKVIAAFREHLPAQLSAVREAIREGNASNLREAAHKLAGIVAAFSPSAANAALELEDLAIADRLQDISPPAARLNDLCQRLLQELEAASIAELLQ
jgi:HPt (histidine-containing phosphotransfer) domain-containing protein